MNLRWPLLVFFVLFNWFAYWAMRRSLAYWIRNADSERRAVLVLRIVFVLLNLPLLAFFFRTLDLALLRVSTGTLEVVFYPSTAWLATVIAFALLAGPVALLWGLYRLLAGQRSRARASSSRNAPALQSDLSRRGFVAGSAGLLIPAFYGIAAYGTYGTLNDLDISAERAIAIPNLPRSLEGMTIVQLSDLHTGPYVREKELRRLVDLVNGLKPDLVAITGDILDWDLASLPDAVRGLDGLRSSLGTCAVLGNHDIYADRYSFAKGHRGGVEIAKGVDTIGIRMLRNEVVYLGEGQDRVALMGLDWLSYNPTNPDFFSYQQTQTRRQLQRMASEIPPDTPRLLLAHHPDTFLDTGPFNIGLTLSGHTHGGGQVLLGTWHGVPLGIAMLRFKYLSGLYQERGQSLYVNRGIGYLGVPIRINCPPEISRFRLVRPENS